MNKTETNFFKKKQNNLYTWSNFNNIGNYSKNYTNQSKSNLTGINTISYDNDDLKLSKKDRLSYNFSLDDSYDKINNIISYYYHERKNSRTSNSLSKNTEYIKRFKNRVEKGAELLPIEKETKNNLSFIKTSFEYLRPKSSILENCIKFEKKKLTSTQNINSDILRLELINLNSYSKNTLEQMHGIEKLKVKSKKKRPSIIDQI